MIVRAVLCNPALIERFDWFNDGKDTIGWLRWIMRTDEAAALADRMEQLYQRGNYATRSSQRSD